MFLSKNNGCFYRRSIRLQTLLHYTINLNVFNFFNKNIICRISHKNQLVEVRRFYEKYQNHQENLFFIICYTSKINYVEYVVGKIRLYTDGEFYFHKMEDELKNQVLSGLGLTDENTYDNETYFKENTLEIKMDFKSKKINERFNKIKLKYFCWDELLSANNILFEKLNRILFDQDIVLNIASTYNPKNKDYNERILKNKYRSALQKIGFINRNTIDTSQQVLQGDIGEFLMHFLVSNYICDDNSLTYLYPKLTLKTGPKNAILGNDGTIYIVERKELYYLEAKFYTDLNKAINVGVKSLISHNEIVQDDIQSTIELFRNVETRYIGEIIEIDDDVKEILVLFLICDNLYMENDINTCLKENKNLQSLQNRYEIVVFVLPILDKSTFLKYFKQESALKGQQLYDE